MFWQRQHARNKPVPERWLKNVLSSTEESVKLIQSRGGKVYFIFFPVDRRIWSAIDLEMPKETYWDQFAKCSSAAGTIHFMDYEGLQVPTGDGRHLDYRTTETFTAELFSIIKNLPMQDKKRQRMSNCF